jgi:radical SAM superfamily enzyme YgiQ (UPF0313 family)
MSFERVLLVMPSGRHGLGFALDIIPTGLEYLAASIEECVSDVHIVDLKMEDRPFDYFLWRFKPDLVGISMCATEHAEGLEIARQARKRGAVTVVGNYHPTGLAGFFASEPDLDFVVRGEGEATLRDLVARGGAEGVAGVSYRAQSGAVVHNPDRPLIEDLDALPFPARHLRRHAYVKRIDKTARRDVLTLSRGCRGRCTFCCEPSMSKSVPRFRSPEPILNEIVEVYARHGKGRLSFSVTDPNALGNAEIMAALCDRLAPLRLDVEFGCHIRADAVVAHPEVIEKMVKAGFFSFEMGIESPNPRDLQATKKGSGTELHEKACRIIRACGAQPLGTFVIGLPDQTEAEILTFPDYGRRIGLSKAAFGIATPFPGTAFYKDLDEQGLIFESDWTKFDEMHSVFHNSSLPDRRVEHLATRCMSRFWTADQLLDIEYLDKIRKGRKKSISQFGRHVRELIDMGQNALVQLQEGDSLSHILEFLRDAPDPSTEEKTRALKIHELIEMDRFLRILGDQVIEITFDYKGQALTSWILELKNRAVDCIKVISGAQDGATVHFRLDLAFLERHPRPSWGQRILLAGKLLRSNRGLARRVNLARLILAAAFN